MKKHIFNTVILLLALCSCKAQSPIVERDASFDGKVQGTYFKDLNNEFNKFEGTWIFTNGNTTFTLVLEKKEMVYDGSEFYFDELFGEYRYIENGVEIVNTLPLLTQHPDNVNNRSVGGGHIIPTNLYVACDDCPPNERRVKLYFFDSERKYLSISLVLRYLQDANHLGQEAQMTATLVSDGGSMLPEDDSPTAPRVPYGEYLMVKQ